MAGLTNEDVVLKFYEKEQGHTQNLRSYGDKLMSYNTCIAQHFGLNGILINISNYDDNAIKNHLALVRKHIGKGHKKIVIHMSDVPIDTNNLRTYFAMNIKL